MIGQELWRTDQTGELSASIDKLRLVIRRCDGYARYLILHRTTHGGTYPEIMLGSGTESDVRTAMIAARRAAMRIAFILAERKSRRRLREATLEEV